MIHIKLQVGLFSSVILNVTQPWVKISYTFSCVCVCVCEFRHTEM